MCTAAARGESEIEPHASRKEELNDGTRMYPLRFLSPPHATENPRAHAVGTVEVQQMGRKVYARTPHTLRTDDFAKSGNCCKSTAGTNCPSGTHGACSTECTASPFSGKTRELGAPGRYANRASVAFSAIAGSGSIDDTPLHPLFKVRKGAPQGHNQSTVHQTIKRRCVMR